MATVITNGKKTIKLYQSVNRGRAMYQLAYYSGGRRVQQNFADKWQAKRVATQILGGLTNDAALVEAASTPEIESLVAAKKVLAPGYALHVAVEEYAQAVASLGKATLREAVRAILSMEDRVFGFRGVAGSGKTTTLREVRRGLESAGHRVIALAPTAKAVRVLQKEGFTEAMTVHSFLLKGSNQEGLRNAVVICDEAGLQSNR